MKQSEFVGVCKFMAGVWGRELSAVQIKAGWTVLKDLPDEAVGEAITRIANEGGDRMPPWPVVVKTARSIADAQRDKLPALPQGDTLSDEEHRHAMSQLRAKETPEQRRRADRMTTETKQLPMIKRLKLAAELLIPPWSRLDPGAWDRIFEQRMAEQAP